MHQVDITNIKRAHWYDKMVPFIRDVVESNDLSEEASFGALITILEILPLDHFFTSPLYILSPKVVGCRVPYSRSLEMLRSSSDCNLLYLQGRGKNGGGGGGVAVVLALSCR
eukprot:COSAG02_NODE_20354_length_835_cov_1.645380_2_plen_112_part_00